MPTIQQNVLIGQELLTAVRLIAVGLRELNRIDGSSDFFHLPIQLLASGFERLMKVVICCYHVEDKGGFPDRKVFPSGKRGHDLVWLLREITDKCFSSSYLDTIPVAQTDLRLLRDDTKLNRIVKILSGFGQSARYYNLNVILGEADPGPSPDEEWAKLEMEILQDDPLWQEKIVDPKQSKAIYHRVNRELTVHCETLARSLSRLFTIGRLGDLARQISGHTHHFLCLTDDQLGQTNYETVRI